MNLRRFYLCLLLSLSLCFVTAFSSYAAIASASDALSSSASASEALPMFPSDDEDYGIMPLSSVGTVSNTVDRTGILVLYWNVSKTRIIGTGYVTSNGRLSSVSFSEPIGAVQFRLNSVAQPPAGNYNFSFSFSSTFSYDVSNLEFFAENNVKNSGAQTAYMRITDFSSSSGDVYLSPVVVAVGSTYFDFTINIKNSTLKNFDGVLSIRFDKSSSSPVFTSPGSSTADIEASYQQGVTSGLSNIGDTLEEIVETISMQLDALWNQLYNYMHLPQMEKLEAIRQAIENIRLDVDVDNQDVVNKLDEQIQNDNNNTQRVEQAVEKHGNFIIEGLKSLFIPDEEYFSSLFDRLHQFFSDRLGFLYVPFDLLIRLLDAIKDADTAFAGIPFPGIQAGEWVLLEPTTVTFDILNEFPELVKALHFITSVVMIGAFLNLLHRKMEEVMSR